MGEWEVGGLDAEREGRRRGLKGRRVGARGEERRKQEEGRRRRIEGGGIVGFGCVDDGVDVVLRAAW